MTEKEFQATLYRAVEDALYLVKGATPFRTGNLKESVKLIATDTGYQIYIDTNKAPYMTYLEEGFTHWITGEFVDVRQGWFREVTELVFRLLRARLKASGKFVGNKE